MHFKSKRLSPSGVLFFCVMLLYGCNRTNTSRLSEQADSSGAKSFEGLAAEEILQKMAEAYQSFEQYVDNAQYHQRFVRHDDGLEVDVPPHMVSVAFRRPNNVRVSRQEPAIDGPGSVVTMTSAGERVRAFVSGYPEQVLEYPLPDDWNADRLFQTNALKQAILPVPVENLFPQLDLLVADSKAGPRLFEADRIERIASDEIDGAVCYRIELERSDEGTRVLWIDEELLLLKRMEMPTRRVRAMMDPDDVLRDLSLWIDFHDAQTNSIPNDEMFEMIVPVGAVLVREFVKSPPQPPDWLGKSVGSARFKDLDGKAVELEEYAGKVLVVDFWFTGCGPCRISMPALEELNDQFSENDQFKMLAISVDAKDIPSATVAKTLRDWGASMQIFRDYDNVGEKELGVTGWPTTLLIGPEGQIHRIARGAKKSYESWREPIDALLAGEDVAAQLLAENKQTVEAFEAKIREVSIQREQSEPVETSEDQSEIESDQAGEKE